MTNEINMVDVLTMIFVAMKLVGLITWSWWLVLTPSLVVWWLVGAIYLNEKINSKRLKEV